jgi:hypothetical protein
LFPRLRLVDFCREISSGIFPELSGKNVRLQLDLLQVARRYPLITIVPTEPAGIRTAEAEWE